MHFFIFVRYLLVWGSCMCHFTDIIKIFVYGSAVILHSLQVSVKCNWLPNKSTNAHAYSALT